MRHHLDTLHGCTAEGARSHSSTGSSTVIESRERLFRSARDLGSYANRAQKQALTNPDRVLLETIAELLALLPAARPGASSTVGGGYEEAQKLPSLFVAYHAQILSGKLTASGQGSHRNERERVALSARSWTSCSRAAR